MRFLAGMSACLCVILSVCGLAGCSKESEPSRPTVRPRNLILISLDTVRADHLSCYGYPRNTTPTIDKFAKTGVLFETCTSPSAWTVPAHLSVFTGVEAATHGCIYYSKPGRLNANFETMAKIFSRNGFRTGAFTGGGYAGKRHGMEIGFDHFESNGNRFENNFQQTIKWVDEQKDNPFFLFFHGFNAHRAYNPPPPYHTRFSEGYNRQPPIRDFGPSFPQPDAVDLKYVISQYDGEIAYIDELMRQFFKFLELRGLLENTLVVLMSDHGDEFYEHGRCDHIHSLYDELTAVPWIMFGPGIPARRIPNQVGTIDMLPTLLSIFGIESNAPFQGADRTGLIFGESVADDAAIFGFTGKGGNPKHLSSVRTKRWKLITNIPGAAHRTCQACINKEAHQVEVWLFDLQDDPGERVNVGGKHPEVVSDLYARLQARIKQSEQLSQAAESSEPPTAEYLERLKSLGYVGDEE